MWNISASHWLMNLLYSGRKNSHFIWLGNFLSTTWPRSVYSYEYLMCVGNGKAGDIITDAGPERREKKCWIFCVTIWINFGIMYSHIFSRSTTMSHLVSIQKRAPQLLYYSILLCRCSFATLTNIFWGEKFVGNSVCNRRPSFVRSWRHD